MSNSELIQEAHDLISSFGSGYQDYAGGPTRQYLGLELVGRGNVSKPVGGWIRRKEMER